VCSLQEAPHLGNCSYAPTVWTVLGDLVRVALAVQSIEDVVSTVRFVKAHNLLLSVKSTGHCYTGNCQAPKSFTLDLAELNWVRLHSTRTRAHGVVSADDRRSVTSLQIMMNTEAGVAHLGPGAVFDDLYAECDAAGMLAVGGMCPTVGMIGFSMGGGHGPLVRSYGLGADSFVDLTVVTANGTLIKVHSEVRLGCSCMPCACTRPEHVTCAARAVPSSFYACG